MMILVNFSLWMSRKLEPLAGTYLRMLPGWYKDPDGDHGALIFVDVQEVRAACWYKDPDGDPSALFSL